MTVVDRTMKRFALLIVALVVLATALSSAQGLADVARAEQERRKTTPKATKVYTNGDLPSDARARSPLPAVPAGIVPAAAVAAAVPAPAEPAPEPPRGENYWRARIIVARQQLQRRTLFAEALQSRINALSTDFVNRDDPAQRAEIGADLQTALAELARVQREILEVTTAIADIEEESRRAGVPPGWLR